MVSAGKVFTNEKGRIISLIFDIFLRLVYTSEKKSTFFTWFCRSVVLQLRRGDFVEDKGEIKMAVLAKHVNLSFEVAQNKSQQFIAHSNNKQALNSILAFFYCRCLVCRLPYPHSRLFPARYPTLRYSI